MPAAPCETVRCATYAVYLRDRNTGEIVEGCDFTEEGLLAVGFSWELNATTGSEVLLKVPDPDCCECVPDPWRHELVYERFDASGRSEGIYWVGPVWHVVDDPIAKNISIQAKDRSVWALERRPKLRNAIRGTYNTAELWLAAFDDAEAGGPSGLVPQYSPTGTDVTVDFLAGDTVTALRDLATDVRWTVAGDEMFGPGPDTVSSLPIASLDVSRHWDEVGAVTDKSGDFLASWVEVRGANGLVGSYPGTEPVADPIYGLHIACIEDTSLTTQAEVDERARQQYEADRDGDTYLITSSSSLSEDAPVSLCELIPGAYYNVENEIGCIASSQLMRVVKTVVELSGNDPVSGRLLERRVAVDFQPVDSGRVSDSRASV